MSTTVVMIERCASEIPVLERPANYGIVIAHSAGFTYDVPQPHTLNRIRKSRELFETGEAKRIITTGRDFGKQMKEELVRMYVPEERIYRVGGWSLVSSTYHARKMINRWIKTSEIPPDIFLHYVIQGWAVPRLEFDIDWVAPMYPYRIHEVPDGRPEEEIYRIDESEEPRRMEIDQRAKRIHSTLHLPPDYAQLVAIGVQTVRECSGSVVRRYGYRLFKR